jgi:MFS transporter, DHA1 family, inner membrane transport protein
MNKHGVGATSVSAGVLSIILIGDALIYVVLPVNAAEFGITLAWVGVLLSANRLIRIFTYGLIARLTDAVGLRRMTLISAVCGAGSTILYGVADGGPILLFARIVWGLSFAAISLTTLAYAVVERDKAGARVGISRAIQQIGPGLSLSAGAWLAGIIGPQAIFTVLGLLSLTAIPLALKLPAETEKPPPASRPWLPRPVRHDILFFVVGFGVDGVFTMTITLILANTVSIEAAMLSGGLLLASRRVVEFVCAPLGGILGDRFGLSRILSLSVVVLAMGFAVIGAGWAFTGAAFIIAARGVIAAVGPAAIAVHEAQHDTMHRLAVMQTWRDFGAAIGPLVSGFLFLSLGAATLYYGIVPILLAALIAMATNRRSPNA